MMSLNISIYKYKKTLFYCIIEVMKLLFGVIFFISSWFYGCSLLVQPSSHSLVVIAVENLPFGVLRCVDGDISNVDGFRKICSEFVRFTHAYTTSSMSQAALGSVLTGLYPYESGLRHNGKDHLPPRFETLAEKLFKRQSHRTALFSGGAAIWRRSGLGQGFEVFDDNINISLSQLYRTSQTNINRFLNWQKVYVKEDLFFAVLYLPDTLFANVPTLTETGLQREASYESQLEELNDSLNFFVEEMKNRKLWDSTHIVLLGLNGRHGYPERNELVGTNLHSEITRVSLFIKPARPPRDLGLHWKVDFNVNLIDVSRTLFDFLNLEWKESKERLSPSISLLPSISEPGAQTDNERFFILESAWPSWKHLGGTRYAVIYQNYLFFYDKSPKIFNTLTDQLEYNELFKRDLELQKMFAIFEPFLLRVGAKPWLSIQFDHARLLHSLIEGSLPYVEQLESKKDMVDYQNIYEDFFDRSALWSIKKKDWKWLEKIGKKTKNTFYQQMALYLRGKGPLPQNKCLDLLNRSTFQKKEDLHLSTCDEKIFLKFISWLHFENSDYSSKVFDYIVREWRFLQIDRKVSEFNNMNGQVWMTKSKDILKPTYFDFILEFPEFDLLKGIVNRRIENIEKQLKSGDYEYY